MGILKTIMEADFDADMTAAAKKSAESLERIMNAE
jgi:hypothetical protein